MADYSITIANVAYVSGSKDSSKNAGATITPGQAVYLDSDTDTWKPADCDASATTAAMGGIALHGSLAGQPLTVQTDGVLNLGTTLTPGVPVVLSGTAGAMAPHTDLATGDYTVIVGIPSTAALLTMSLFAPGYLHG